MPLSYARAMVLPRPAVSDVILSALRYIRAPGQSGFMGSRCAAPAAWLPEHTARLGRRRARWRRPGPTGRIRHGFRARDGEAALVVGPAIMDPSAGAARSASDGAARARGQGTK